MGRTARAISPYTFINTTSSVVRMAIMYLQRVMVIADRRYELYVVVDGSLMPNNSHVNISDSQKVAHGHTDPVEYDRQVHHDDGSGVHYEA